jgi:hypothetical protein
MLYFLFAALGLSQSFAQSTQWVDKAAIRRGAEMHLYCVPKQPEERLACGERASRSLIGNNYALLGYFYSSFLIEAAVLETLQKNDPRIPQPVIDSFTNTIKAALHGLKTMQDQTFVPYERLCVIVRRSCAKAEASHRKWDPKYYPSVTGQAQ